MIGEDTDSTEMLRHDFITLREGMEYYRLNEKPMVRLAREAGAVYKIGKMVRVRRTIFEAYLRRIMLIEVAETDEEDEGFDGRGK